MGEIEKRNNDTINRLRDELRRTKEELNQERAQNSSKNHKDIQALNSKVNKI